MRTILTAAALSGILLSGAVPALADGNDVGGGQSRWQAWQQASHPVASLESRPRTRTYLSGGDDQYVAGATRSQAWQQPINTNAETAARPASANFVLASQGN